MERRENMHNVMFIILVIVVLLLLLLLRRKSVSPKPALIPSWSIDNAFVSPDYGMMLIRDPVNTLYVGEMITPRLMWDIEAGSMTPSTDLYSGDVDGDGINEVVTNFLNRIVVIKNGSVSRYELPYNPAYYMIDVVGLYDVNNDGKKEILLSLNYQFNRIGYSIVDVAGNIVKENTNVKSGSRVEPFDIVIHDGMIIVMHSGGITALDMNDNVVFDVSVDLSSLFEFSRMAIGDINGDGVKEIVIPDGSGVKAYRISDGSRVMNKFLGYDFITVMLYDVDGDGVMEIVTCGIMNDSGLYEWVIIKGDSILRRIAVDYLRQYSPVVADVDGDGSVEIVVNDLTYVKCFSIGGNLKWYYDLGDYGMRGLSAGDLNDDGKMEIVAMTYDTVFILRGDGLFIASIPLYEENGYYSLTGVSPVIDDVDGDKKLELVFDYMTFDPSTGRESYRVRAYE